MGCDIHIRTEIKKQGKWLNADFYEKSKYPNEKEFDIIEIYSQRSYSLFATLANVRNNHDLIIPIAEPRGIPQDASEDYLRLVELWDGDGHSHSYFTLQELESVFKEHSKVYHKGLISEQQAIRLQNGILPKTWCQGTNQEGYTWHQWQDENSGFIYLVNQLRERLTHYHPYDPENHKDDIRIVFFFDN